MPQDQILLLMKEVGFINLSGSISGDEAQTADLALWFILLDDDVVMAEYDAARDRVILRADVEHPAPGNSAELFDFLLQYNDHYPETGLRLALDEEDGQVVLIADLPCGRLDAESLQLALVNVNKQRNHWRSIVPQVAATPDADLAAPSVGEAMLRV